MGNLQGITHHKAISVTSGYWVGGPGAERELFNVSGSLTSGTVDTNAIQDAAVTSGKIASGNIVLSHLGKTMYDYGISGLSGHITSISTRVAGGISFAQANNYGPLPVAHSGIHLGVSWSGHLLNLYKYSVDGSAATSSQVAWSVWG